jgi:hypothetical protein
MHVSKKFLFLKAKFPAIADGEFFIRIASRYLTPLAMTSYGEV